MHGVQPKRLKSSVQWEIKYIYEYLNSQYKTYEYENFRVIGPIGPADDWWDRDTFIFNETFAFTPFPLVSFILYSNALFTLSQVGLAGVFCGVSFSGLGLSWLVGRRLPVLVGAPLAFFAALLFAASSGFVPLVIERFFVGLGIGAILQAYA